MAQETKYYEVSYWLSPALTEDQVGVAHEELRTLLDAHNAAIESWDSPKRRHLAHSIEKGNEGYFGAFRFTAPTIEAKIIDKKVRERKNILRTMLLEWHRHIPRQYGTFGKQNRKEDYVPTDEKALDKRLEEILGETPTKVAPATSLEETAANEPQ